MRFTLQTLLLSFVVIWASLAAFGPGGILVAALLLAVAAHIRSGVPMGRWLVFVLVILVLLALTFPLRQIARQSALQAGCRSRLHQIALALHLYHEDHGCLPPAGDPGPDGEPMPSWRVLILPYLEERSLYDDYDFSEPWDGPNNRKLAPSLLYFYRCPSAGTPNANQPNTSYVAVVGPETSWSGSESVRLDPYAEGADETILVVELPDCDVHWMQPRDVTVDELCQRLRDLSDKPADAAHMKRNGYFFHDQPGFNAAMADTHSWFLPVDLPPEVLRALLTSDDGKSIDLVRELSQTKRLRWSHIVALIVLAVSYAILLLRPRGKSDTVAISSNGEQLP